MTIEEIEELIRKYLSTGIAVIVILVAPGTATGGGSPEVITIDPGTTPSDTRPGTAPTTGARPSTGTSTDNSRSGTGSSGSATRPDTGSGTPTRPGGTTNNSGTDSSTSRNGSGSTSSAGTTTKPDTNTSGSTRTQPDSTTNDNRTTNNGTGSSGTGSGGTTDNNRTGSSGTNNDGASTTPGNRSGTGSNRPRAGTGSTDQQNGRNNQSDNQSSTQNDSGNENTINNTDQTRGTGSPSDRNTGNARGSDNSSDGVTAAEKFGWGRPNRSDDFTDGVGQWNIYDGPGHAGQGTRSPSAVSTDGGILTITGDSSGTTAGMAWNPGQKYGRWEGRVRAPASDPSYNALLLLWPDAEDFPVGGEIDFMEMMDPSRQRTNLFLHYGESNSQVEGQVEIDATQWHNWALEWTPDAITAYVDGEEWWRTTDTSIFPPGPMHLCIQLDWFPEGDNPRESTMEVDWVRQYSLEGNGEAATQENREGSNSAEQPTPVRNVIRKMFSWR